MNIGKRKLTLMSVALCTVVVAALVMFGCSKPTTQTQESQTSPQPEAPTSSLTYTPGTYEGSALGHNGEVSVQVEVTADKITSIKVADNKETVGIGELALQEVSKNIVDTQSLAVDSLSGATVSSGAMKQAVENALSKATSDVSALKQKPEKTQVAKVDKTIDTELLVIGGGASGMSAALRADELGIQTTLLEKMPFLGGALAISGGNQVVSGSELQAQQGVTNDSPQSMIDDFMKNGAGKNVPELLKLYAENVGTTTDWLNTYAGVTYNLEGGLHKLAEYSHDRELAYTGGGSGAAQAFRAKLDSSKVDVQKNTRVVELLVDDKGAIVGAKAENPTENITVNAKAVILATGGYGASDLASEDLKKSLYYGPISSTGDGIKLATSDKINAATRLMEYGKRYPNGIEVAPGLAKSTINGNIAVFKENGILVNKLGKRVVNEKSSNRSILEVEVQQPDSMLFVLLDQEGFDLFKSGLGEGGISAEKVDEWLKNNGSSAPIFAHGKTVADLAQTVGMDAATLQQTIDTYNSYVDAGVDSEFNRPADFLKKKIGEGPYYLVEQKPRFATTMGGLVVTTNLEVKNKDDQVIPNLFAVGEVASGVMGDDSPSGANNGWAVTSGKLSAESVAALLGKLSNTEQKKAA